MPKEEPLSSPAKRATPSSQPASPSKRVAGTSGGGAGAKWTLEDTLSSLQEYTLVLGLLHLNNAANLPEAQRTELGRLIGKTPSAVSTFMYRGLRQDIAKLEKSLKDQKGGGAS
ncbi:hypothetical protein CBOM_02893 [Ceraceosorus bombacis]|uniref:Uncharacterized protein n=1 Tax=Ceraceosorus bombacis TaxID=401625 RepID=A0A0P1BHN1_9BASI|nr:hypothetical protein CBOM_02893 [Ceraceosorus bombacis]